MKVIIKICKTESEMACYINNSLIINFHGFIGENSQKLIEDKISECLSKLIHENNEEISEIDTEHHIINNEYIKENGYSQKFTDIPEEMVE